ncbi:MAG: hypothetical protein ACKVP7_20285 [Hyphomicrobiaceae bacterium]
MSKIEDIKQAAAALSREELAKLRAWLDELDEQRFDEQIERDVKAGKLDWLADEAEAQAAAGQLRRVK